MIARSLLLATALLAASRAAGARANSPADDASRRRCCAPTCTVSSDIVRIGDVIDNAGSAGADRDLPRAGSRHHRHAAGRAGAQHPARPSGDRRRHPRPQGDFGDAAGPHARRQGHRAADRPRAGAPQRSRRRRQPVADLRSRSRRRQARCRLHRRHAADHRALRPRATAASTSPSRSATTTAPPLQSCASPARRSRPSKPRCWRAMSSATRS